MRIKNETHPAVFTVTSDEGHSYQHRTFRVLVTTQAQAIGDAIADTIDPNVYGGEPYGVRDQLVYTNLRARGVRAIVHAYSQNTLVLKFTKYHNNADWYRYSVELPSDPSALPEAYKAWHAIDRALEKLGKGRECPIAMTTALVKCGYVRGCVVPRYENVNDGVETVLLASGRSELNSYPEPVTIEQANAAYEASKARVHAAERAKREAEELAAARAAQLELTDSEFVAAE